MLPGASAQDLFRALGSWLDRELPPAAPLPALHIADAADGAGLQVTVGECQRFFDLPALEALVVAGRARRGIVGAGGGPLADLLRAVGSALDVEHATRSMIDLANDELRIRFVHEDHTPVYITYRGADLDALRQDAAARRRGIRRRRVVVLTDDVQASKGLAPHLAVEFDVEVASLAQASAVSESDTLPDVVLLHPRHSLLVVTEALRTFQRSPRGRNVPLLLRADPMLSLAFQAYADILPSVSDDVSPEDLRAAVRARIPEALLGEESVTVAPPEEAAEQEGVEVRTGTVLMTDLRGFTGLAEQYADRPQVLLGIINQHLHAVVRVVAGCGGVVEKFTGDGVLATFNVRDSLPTHRHRALVAALEAVSANEALNRRHARQWGFRLEIGVGIATGPVVIGQLGPPERAEDGVLGDTINVAARLVAEASAGEVLVTGETYAGLEALAPAYKRAFAPVRGRENYVEVVHLAGCGTAWLPMDRILLDARHMALTA